MRSNFIAAWVTQQQRSFRQSTRGIMTPEARQTLEDEAERGMREIERAAAEEAWDEGFKLATRNSPSRPHPMLNANPYSAAALGLTAGQEGKQ